MKIIFLTAFVALLSHNVALSADAEYGVGWKSINNEEFRSRFKVKGEIFILDPTGKKFVTPTSEIREWRPGIKSGKIDTAWSVSADTIAEVAIHQAWHIKDDNSIEVTIQQYDHADREKSVTKEMKYGKMIREEKYSVENFAPISWVAESTSERRVILRFTPELDAIHDEESLEKIPIGGDRGSFTVTDNQGYLWGDEVRFGGLFAGMTCHRGSFVISLYPFKGAKQMGYANGKVMELNFTDELKVKIRSETDLIPGEMRVKVYGKYIPNFKSIGTTHATSYGQRGLDTFPKEFRQ